LNDDHDGIIELPPMRRSANRREGARLDDPVIDVSITPNRGDCTSVYGIARDLAAAGIGRLREGDLSAVAGKFPSPSRQRSIFRRAQKMPHQCSPGA